MWVRTMRLLILLSSILAVYARFVSKECNGININGVFHEAEVLKEDLDRPYLLAANRGSDILYFSYSVKNDDDSSRTARYDLRTKEFKDIKGVENGFAQAVDEKHHKLYIGGSNGIYSYDDESDSANFYAEKDVNIWNLYYRDDKIYFSVYPTQFLFAYSNGNTERVKELEDTKVDNFVVDNEGIMFFTNATGLFAKGGGKEILFQEYKDIGVRGLNIDVNGTVYAVLQDGVYKVNKYSKTVDKVVDIEDAFGVAFDKDNNMIYSDSSKLVRLKPNLNKEC